MWAGWPEDKELWGKEMSVNASLLFMFLLGCIVQSIISAYIRHRDRRKSLAELEIEIIEMGEDGNLRKISAEHLEELDRVIGFEKRARAYRPVQRNEEEGRTNYAGKD